MEKQVSVSETSSELEVPSASGDSVEKLPEKVEADFAPLVEVAAENEPEKTELDPHHAESLRAQEAFELAGKAAAAGNEDEAVQYYLKASNLAEAAREWYLTAVSCQRVGDFLCNSRPPEDLERAFRMYYRAVSAYEQCGLFDEARRLSYRLMGLKMRRARQLRLPLLVQSELVIYWAAAGFGYRPLRVIASSVVVVMAYALLYWATNGVIAASDSSHPIEFWECLYFSGITFATIGYGDFIPSPQMRFVALTEGAVGVLTMSFFVVALTNRLRH